MGIYKRSGSKLWWVRIYVRGGSRDNQKVIRVSTGTDDEAKALAIERTLMSAYNRTMGADRLHKIIDALTGCDNNTKDYLPVSMVFDEHKRWVSTINKKLSKGTLAHRGSACARFIQWVGKCYPSAAYAENVDRKCALAYSEHLNKEGLKSKSRRNNIGDLGTVWASLMRIRDGITSNPWTLVLPQVSDDYRRGVPFTRDDESKVIAAADACGHGWGLACRIARYTGLRYGDAVTLRLGDVDLSAGVISVTPSKTRRHQISLRIPINKRLLKSILALQSKASNPKPEDFLIPELGGRFPLEFKPCKFSKVLEAAGVETGKYTFHSWRHTFRTRLAEAGVSDEIARRLGGWTNDGMALHYDHDGRLADLRKAVDKI